MLFNIASVRNADAAQTFHVAGALWSLLLRSEESEHRLSAALVVLPPDIGPPPHVHEREDEFYFVLQGEVDFLLGSDRRLVQAGDFVCCPRGVPHGMMNRSTRDARLLALSQPGGLDRYVADAGRHVLPGEPAPHEITQDDIARMFEAAAAHHITFLT
ncbi:MAG: cupin domain-containing protein [Phycisphaerales bacterium]